MSNTETRYNIGFRINDILLEIIIVKELLLEGFNVKRLSKNAYSVTDVTIDWVNRIERVSDKYWYF